MQPKDTSLLPPVLSGLDWGSGLGSRPREGPLHLKLRTPPSPQLVTRMPARLNLSLLCPLDKP